MKPGELMIEDQSFYTSWMRREGDYLIVQFEVLSLGPTNSKVTVSGLTKNEEQLDSQQVNLQASGGSPATLDLDTLGTAAITFAQQDIKELVRLKFVGTSSGVDAPFWVFYRVLGFVWYDKASA